MFDRLLAGFLAAWAAVYVVLTAQAIWAAKRKARPRGAIELAQLWALLAGSSAATALGMATGEPWALRVGRAASLAAPLALRRYVLRETSTDGAGPARTNLVLLTVTLAGVVAELGGVLHSEAEHTAVASRSPLGIAFSVFVVGTILHVAYSVARHRETLGRAAFVGAAILCGASTYDGVMDGAGVPHTPAIQAAYVAFSLALLSGQVARFVERRERLAATASELRERSRVLSRAFRELRSKQAELVKREQLAAIGELSAVVAHEVRNPLAVMSNAVATLKRPTATEQERALLLEILSEETDRLNHLVGDLLRYAKPMPVERGTVSLREIVEKATRSLVTTPNLLVELQVDANVPRIAGDPLLIRQAVDNLVHNAVQAMGSGGTLSIKLRAVGEDGVELVVGDTGEGMDTFVRARALDPFFTTRPAGTGLGLAIVSRVVDAHGGRLQIESARGAGTQVKLVLPLEPAPPNSHRELGVLEAALLAETEPPSSDSKPHPETTSV